MASTGVKAILGYNIAEGVSVHEYERWLWDVHYPDLLANPYLDRVVLDTVIRPITETSAGTPIGQDVQVFDRIAEMHYSSHEAYEAYLEWFKANPIPVDRSPAGRTEFRFYVLCDVEVAARTPDD